jgi:hypothetical protein
LIFEECVKTEGSVFFLFADGKQGQKLEHLKSQTGLPCLYEVQMADSADTAAATIANVCDHQTEGK